MTPDIRLSEDDLLTPGMLSFRADRPPSRNARGGVLICAKEQLHPSQPECMMNGLEGLSVKLSWKGDVFNVVAFYNRPNNKTFSTTSALRQVIASLNVHNPTVLLGDMNQDLNKDNQVQITNFLQGLGFKQYVHKPTTDYGSILDHIYVM